MNKKKVIVPIVAGVATLGILTGVSYAYFSAKITENNKTETIMKSNELGLTFTGVSEITASSMIPGDSFTKTFSVENTSNRAVTYNIYMQNITNEFNEDLVYTLIDDNGEVVAETALPATNTEKSYLKTNVEIESGVTKNYTLKIEYKYLDTPQNDYQGKTFNATLGIDTEQIQLGVNLYNMIKENASNETIDFSVRSGTSGTNGIYSTTATEGNVPVYYYRGKVDNNIIFNNMCWKIVRTTETGGVKLIYNGTPTDGQCLATTGDATQIGWSAFNTNYNDNAYVGYMYGTTGSSTYAETHTNTNESTIKKESIDPWFAANFNSEAIAKLEDTVFCNDRSTTTGGNNNTLQSWYGSLGYGTNATAYGAAARASYYTTTPNPSLVCPNANDKFTVSESYGNGALTYPVGLITLDEAVLAGFNTKESNSSDYLDTNNYLYTNRSYWAFSPFDMFSIAGAFVGTVYATGYVGDGNVYTARGVRPAVSLADGTLVTGKGTRTNPYVVK